VLTRELMGYVALFILWGNTVLVLLAALKPTAALWRLAGSWPRAEAAPGASGLFRARIEQIRSGPFAEFSVEQLGRFGAGAGRSIVWHDRRCACRIGGGIVVADGTRIEVPATDRARVWVGADEVDRAAGCPSHAAFEEAYPEARKAKGVVRNVSVALEQGRDVFVAGRLRGGRDALRLEPLDDGVLFVSALDPLVWCRRRILTFALLFVPAVVGGAALATGLALTEPVFDGLASKAGGLWGLVFFLLVLPAGTALRDFLREPAQRIVRGRWDEPSLSTFRAPAEPSDRATAPEAR
jgi:hypothetical protein